jgi:hypothetical protein
MAGPLGDTENTSQEVDAKGSLIPTGINLGNNEYLEPEMTRN